MLAVLLLTTTLLMGSACAENHINAYNMEITANYVKADGVCSCSLCTNRYHHTSYFCNYCPACKRYHTLCFEEGPADNNQCPEGMWYCSYCDADYCLVHGKEHWDPTNYYLTLYVDGSSVQNMTQVETSVEYVSINVMNKSYTFDKNILDKLKKEKGIFK